MHINPVGMKKASKFYKVSTQFLLSVDIKNVKYGIHYKFECVWEKGWMDGRIWGAAK